MSGSHFGRALEMYPDLMTILEKVQEYRAITLADQAHGAVLDVINKGGDPKALRAIVDALIKLAGFYNRQRFGDKLDVSVDQQISISGALAEALARRSNSPPRDLTQSANRQAIDAPYIMLPNAPDKQSEAPARPLPDFFED